MDGSQRDYRGVSKGFVLFAAAYLLFAGVVTMLTQVGLPDSAAAIPRAWLKSDGHRKIVVSTSYNYVGIGLSVAADGKK